MVKLSTWLAGKSHPPPAFLFFLVGAILTVLSTAEGLKVPAWPRFIPDGSQRTLSLAFGLAFLFLAILLDYLGQKRTVRSAPPIWVPVDLTQSFWLRRDRLTRTQRKILDVIERASFPDRPIDQNQIEQRFAEMTASEVFYRLEHLRLLGFLEHENHNGHGQNVYCLSSAYRRELERIGIDRPSYTA